MVKSNTPVTTQGRQHQDQDRTQQRPGRPQGGQTGQSGQAGQAGGRKEFGGSTQGIQISKGGRSGQGQYGRSGGASETAVLGTCLETISGTFNYCLEQGDKHVEATHLRSLVDCWDIVQVTSNLIARESEYADRFKPFAAEAVKACEESCEGFEGDERMTACADTCRQAYEYLSGDSRAGSSGNKPNRGGEEE